MTAQFQITTKEISKFISDFQKVKLVTSVFEFLDKISPYDYSWSYKEEMLRIEFPNVWEFLNDYNKCLKQFDKQLREFYNCNKRAESKKLAEKLDEIIGHLDNQLEPDKVKTKISKDYIPKNLFEKEMLYGQISVTKPYIWSEFKIEMLEMDYLFEDYFGLLYNQLEIFRYYVEQFKTGYKNYKAGKVLPHYPKLPANASLHEIIFPEKWNDFIQQCIYYSKERKFDGVLFSAKVITRRDPNLFIWVGFSNSAIPPLGQFVKLLADNDFFDFNERMVICRSFLKFFNLPSEIENAKYLSKKASSSKSKYKDYFILHKD